MRPGLLFGTLICTLFFSQLLFGKKESLAPKLTVRQEFESELSNVKKNLKASSALDEKLKVLSKSEREIEMLRKKNPIQLDQDEIYMDMVIVSLKQIPRGTFFKKAECKDYRSKIQSAFNPKAETSPNLPITETLTILNLLCQ